MRFSPVTDADLARARTDPAFRQQLLTQSLELLVSRLNKQRRAAPASGASAKQIRDGVELALRLAELIQTAPEPARDR